MDRKLCGKNWKLYFFQLTVITEIIVFVPYPVILSSYTALQLSNFEVQFYCI